MSSKRRRKAAPALAAFDRDAAAERIVLAALRGQDEAMARAVLTLPPSEHPWVLLRAVGGMAAVLREAGLAETVVNDLEAGQAGR
ncbi:hypothetical protein [Streptomyces sp. YIM 98790]|uniref:hypothetical protein n=1 Tax=Streptomyces sp. YIM 98790 TaxID=2689077 RepID=UPI00140CD7DC|nr:hypothetical protein [Streptomyces sp. YIM 98790]